MEHTSTHVIRRPRFLSLAFFLWRERAVDWFGSCAGLGCFVLLFPVLLSRPAGRSHMPSRILFASQAGGFLVVVYLLASWMTRLFFW